jgi:hypothetical protein
MSHAGSCHCGRIAFRVEGTPEKVYECNCSLCSRRGYLLWFVPREALQLETPAEAMSTYTFNSHRIRHHFCPVCGCAPFGEGSRQDGSPMAAVNVRCLTDLELSALERVPVDGRSL